MNTRFKAALQHEMNQSLGLLGFYVSKNLLIVAELKNHKSLGQACNFSYLICRGF